MRNATRGSLVIPMTPSRHIFQTQKVVPLLRNKTEEKEAIKTKVRFKEDALEANLRYLLK